MKRILKWALPITLITLLTFTILSFLKIYTSCAPSICSGNICTSDCNKEATNHDYTSIIIMGITNLTILISWIFFIKQSKKPKS